MCIRDREKEVQRIGDSKIRKTDCRVVSATNKLPEEAIRDGELREDLFYRLSTGIIWLPNLREREGDLQMCIRDRYCFNGALTGKGLIHQAAVTLDYHNRNI